MACNLIINFSEVYLDRVQSQEELAKLLDYCMKGKEKINLVEFTHITDKLSSEMFLCVPLSFYLGFYANADKNTFL